MADHQRLIRVRVKTTSDPKTLVQRLGMVRGVHGATTSELPGGFVALDIAVDANLKEHEIDGFGEVLVDVLSERKDVQEAVKEYIWSPVPIAAERWLGTDDPGEIVQLIDGVPFIRLDYYAKSLDFSDLGIGLVESERMFQTALGGWPQPGPRREAIRRLASHYNRVPVVIEFAQHLQREEHAQADAELAVEPVGAES